MPSAGESSRPPRIYASLLGMGSLPLIVGGAWLISLGGSPYYLCAGLMLMVSALLLWRRRHEGIWCYLALIAGTVTWAVWDTGWNEWALVPRLALPGLMGAWMLTPGFKRRIGPAMPLWGRLSIDMGPSRAISALLVAAALGTALHAFQTPPADPAFTVASSIDDAGETGAPNAKTAGADWTVYGGDQGGLRYSGLTQVTPQNVAELQPAWTFHTGPTPKDALDSTLEVTPLKIGDTVYICTGFNDVIALDAENGRQRWRYDAKARVEGVWTGRCRGLAYYRASGPVKDCPERIITNTIDARLIALDARTGSPCRSFGRDGQVSLLAGMGPMDHGYYHVTSAPVIARGRVVLGGWVSDGQYWGEPSGVIRAFDVNTGAFSWAWDMGRPSDHHEPAPGQSYTRSTPNSWAPMSVDEKAGLVFIPTGVSSGNEWYGCDRRPFDEKYANSVIALDAESGDVRWSFQTTHHDLWDYDVASQPTLVDFPMGSGRLPAVVVPTKRGEIFVLDRRSGRPITQVVERAVPTKGAAPGERVSARQPFSTGMPSFAGPELSESMMWGLTPFDQLYCRIMFKSARYEGPATPPGLTPSIQYPGFVGGLNWGGVSIDPARRLMIVNSNRIANYVQMMPRAEANRRKIYPITKNALPSGNGDPMGNTPYAVDIKIFMSPIGLPCQQPPFGMLSAVDLAQRKTIWSRPFGQARDIGAFGIASRLPIELGTFSLGGSMTTASGLIFVAASQEWALQAIDTGSGKILWKGRLPAGGHATPMTYMSGSGRQFILVAAGGYAPLQTGHSDTIMAYALPKPLAHPGIAATGVR